MDEATRELRSEARRAHREFLIAEDLERQRKVDAVFGYVAPPVRPLNTKELRRERETEAQRRRRHNARMGA